MASPREIGRWILHEDQNDLYEFLVALGLIVLFLALLVPVLWPLGHLSLIPDLARGYGVLWLALWATAAVMRLLQRWFKVNLYDRSTLYLIMGLITGASLQTGWSAYAALAVHPLATEASTWSATLLYLAGGLSCLMAFFAVSTVYQGTLYRLLNLPIAGLTFLAFSLWPQAGGTLYGWFFRIF